MKHLLVIFILSATVSCTQTKKVPQPAKAQKTWSNTMLEMALSLEKLIPYIYSDKKFKDEENYKKVSSLISEFYAKAHSLNPQKEKQYLGDDPMLPLGVAGLERGLKGALRTYQDGNKDYSQTILKSSLGYCFKCHTRTDFGPESLNWNIDIENYNLTVVEKVELLVAMRSYETALQMLRNYLVWPAKMDRDNINKEKALKYYLTLMVRVKKQPHEAYEVLLRLSQNNEIPDDTLKVIEAWEKSLKNWVIESEIDFKKDTFKKAKLLMKRFNDDKVPYNNTNFIELLRVTELLHHSLESLKSKWQRAEAFEMLGIAYELGDNVGFWELPANYFEFCVREAPKSVIARRCYERYNENITFGYTGSAGTFIPYYEQQKIKELKKLSGHK